VFKDTTLPILAFSLSNVHFVDFNFCYLREEINVIWNTTNQFRAVYRRSHPWSTGPYNEHSGYKGE
jgi:hypothetical protein